MLGNSDIYLSFDVSMSLVYWENKEVSVVVSVQLLREGVEMRLGDRY